MKPIAIARDSVAAADPASAAQGAPQGTPKASLSALDGIAMLVGIVVGIGIFRTPQIVALNVSSEWAFVGFWLIGGAVTLVGAFVYAELGSAYPHAGGEYHYLRRALGRHVALLFAWARLTVIQTGAIAAVAFVFGDYAQGVLPLGPWGPALYAAGAIMVFTAINLTSSRQSRTLQLVFTILTILAVLAIAGFGLALGSAPTPAPAATDAGSASGAFGLAMVLILLTYGGWNEVAYLSGEMKDVRRNMPRVLVISVAVITGLYFLINLAYLNVLGLDGLRASDVVAADTLHQLFGPGASLAVALLVCFAALSTMNATIFTGARLYYSLGRELPLLGRIGLWEERSNMPVNAILAQSAIALALVVFGASTRVGFQAMVEYTAPVFWFFLRLVGVSFFLLRQRESGRTDRFRAPLYPLTPALFCLTCAYLLYASIAYTGYGALVGVGVLLAGVPFIRLGATAKAA
ncbi:amino acid/polyamine/organocation transporter (APC superfamily) [Ancylobacter aquaticus]|uniref:Amino acid/polyamine/organocation transporter (APC superfamily) n=1 Tax=Ancylobacter aquaticus TaxID=100 RepID=A0A4R1I8P7_ANCAQ|nr:amino acid permease [Ancylobacter aquaticus]TCK30513.1 amino acid/polyamine/organocation transporter (APC superfamily) [Ancylobacter aquaticus]